MTSFRFPQIEVIDCIRQLVYVKDYTQWVRIAADNPEWQLNERSVYSLNGIRRITNVPEDHRPILDSEGNVIPQPYAEQPFVPPASENEDNNTLIRPILFDNINEAFIQASTDKRPLTATLCQYGYADTTSNAIGTMNVGCFLLVLNQEAAQSRLLRYFNWFDYVLRFDREAALIASNKYPGYQGIDPSTQFNLYDYVVKLRRTGPLQVTIEGFDSIERKAAIGINIAIELQYISGANNPHDL